MAKNNTRNKIMKSIATFIVDNRKAIYLMFGVAVIFCLSNVGRVNVNDDLAEYLSKETETRIGVDLMDEEFQTYGSAQLMISNITYDKADEIYHYIEDMDGIMKVSFDETKEHYKDAKGYYQILFDGEETDENVLRAMAELKDYIKDYNYYINSKVANSEQAELEAEMKVVLVFAVIVIIGVTLFTSKSFIEIPILLLVFGVAAILNLGTHYWFGTISFITNAIAVILQLALAVDYAIILIHRFLEEKEIHEPRTAIIEALSKAIVEISASSLTTMAGLLALTTMHYRIGFDMGVVLIKGILFSLVTVFLLMPGILLNCNRLIDRTRHKSFVPEIKGWGRLIVKTKKIVPIIFLVVFFAGMFFSFKCSYTFAKDYIDTNNPSNTRISQDIINENFGIKNQIALMIPKGEYAKEKIIIDKIKSLDKVVNVTALSSVEADEDKGAMLTDSYDPRQFSELLKIDIEESRMLFRAYGIENENYSVILQDIDDAKFPIIDLADYVLEKRASGTLDLTDEQNKDLDDLEKDLDTAKNQLEGNKYTRLVIEADVEDEGEDATYTLEKVEEIAKQEYKEVFVASNLTLAKDLKSSFSHDNQTISLLTDFFVMVILLFTFRNVGLPFILILSIQGSIFINFSFPYLTGSNLYFLGYLVVSSIQMGATIDYAILITNRYLSLTEKMNKDEAVVEALNQAFPTILTSGSMLTIAGYLIGGMTTNPIIASVGLTLGRGTLISIIIVMTVLPQLLNIADPLIKKLRLNSYKPGMLTASLIKGKEKEAAINENN